MRRFFVLLSALMLLMTSCDDGRIYEEEIEIPTDGRTVHFSANVTGLKSWPDAYVVALASFDGTSDYAVASKKVLPPSEEGGAVSTTLSNISEDITSVELCVVTRLGKKVMSLMTLEGKDLSGSSIVEMKGGDMNLSMYDIIQTKVFNTTCTACHGGSTSAAAGLYLTGDKSYDALVSVPSRKMSDLNLVEPGNADKSVLYIALSTEVSVENEWHYKHNHEVESIDIRSMIKSWIDNGAKK